MICRDYSLSRNPSFIGTFDEGQVVPLEPLEDEWQLPGQVHLVRQTHYSSANPSTHDNTQQEVINENENSGDQWATRLCDTLHRDGSGRPAKNIAKTGY